MPKSWEVLSFNCPMGQLPTGGKPLVLFWLDHVIDMNIMEDEEPTNLAERQNERKMRDPRRQVRRAER